MKPEEIAIHCLIFFILLIIGIFLLQVWKYLNSKALGSQTVLDDLAKDGIVILGLGLIASWLSWMKIVNQYNYHIAMGTVRTVLALRVALYAQGMAFSVGECGLVWQLRNLLASLAKKYATSTLSTFSNKLSLLLRIGHSYC